MIRDSKGKFVKQITPKEDLKEERELDFGKIICMLFLVISSIPFFLVLLKNPIANSITSMSNMIACAESFPDVCKNLCAACNFNKCWDLCDCGDCIECLEIHFPHMDFYAK